MIRRNLRTYSSRLARTSILATMVALAIATGSHGHFRQSDGDWFYSGHTHTGSNPRVDPLNVFFHDHGGDRQIDYGYILRFWTCQSGQNSCGAPYYMRAPGSFCASKQSIYDKHPRVDDEVDDQYVTQCQDDKWHARVWDSHEHDRDHPAQHSGSNVRQFAIAGIHFDKCCPDRHIAKRGWEDAERYTISKLREFCSWRNALRLPGSKGRFQRDYSNGKITRISPEFVPSYGGNGCG